MVECFINGKKWRVDCVGTVHKLPVCSEMQEVGRINPIYFNMVGNTIIRWVRNSIKLEDSSLTLRMTSFFPLSSYIILNIPKIF
jgi:hypothetical protein